MLLHIISRDDAGSGIASRLIISAFRPSEHPLLTAFTGEVHQQALWLSQHTLNYDMLGDTKRRREH